MLRRWRFTNHSSDGNVTPSTRSGGGSPNPTSILTNAIASPEAMPATAYVLKCVMLPNAPSAPKRLSRRAGAGDNLTPYRGQKASRAQ